MKQNWIIVNKKKIKRESIQHKNDVWKLYGYNIACDFWFKGHLFSVFFFWLNSVVFLFGIYLAQKCCSVHVFANKEKYTHHTKKKKRKKMLNIYVISETIFWWTFWLFTYFFFLYTNKTESNGNYANWYKKKITKSSSYVSTQIRWINEATTTTKNI